MTIIPTSLNSSPNNISDVNEQLRLASESLKKNIPDKLSKIKHSLANSHGGYENSTNLALNIPLIKLNDLFTSSPLNHTNSSYHSQSSSNLSAYNSNSSSPLGSTSRSRTNSPQLERLNLRNLGKNEKINMDIILQNLKSNNNIDSIIANLVKNKSTLSLKKDDITNIITTIKNQAHKDNKTNKHKKITKNNEEFLFDFSPNFYNKHVYNFPCSALVDKTGIYLLLKHQPQDLPCEGGFAKVSCALKLTQEDPKVIAWRSTRKKDCGDEEIFINKKLSEYPNFFVVAKPINYKSFWRLRGEKKALSPKNKVHEKKGFPLEYCKCLVDIVENYIPFSLALKWMIEITEALAFLHKKEYVHRDLKLDNILISEENNVAKLADFGFTQQPGMMKTGLSTLSYLPPEIINPSARKPHFSDYRVEYSQDMFSLGVLFLELLDKDSTWINSNITNRAINDDEKNSILDKIEAHYFQDRDGYTKDSILAVCDLIYECLNKNPQKRIKAENLHQKLTKIAKERIGSQAYNLTMLKKFQDMTPRAST
jgi:hypothetical protein